MFLQKSGPWGVLPKAFELLERVKELCVAVPEVVAHTLDKIAILEEPLFYILCNSCKRARTACHIIDEFNFVAHY